MKKPAKKSAISSGAEHARNRLHVRHDSGINLVARSWGDRGNAATKSSSPRWSTTPISSPGNNPPSGPGAVLKHIPITDDGLLILDELDTLLTNRTKITALASSLSVSNVLGTINPIKEIARQVHAAGALVLVDAAQSVPHFTTNVRDMGASRFPRLSVATRCSLPPASACSTAARNCRRHATVPAAA
jgi:hypothetical protein